MGTSQAILALLFTTWAPSGALAIMIRESAPPALRRSSCGLISGSFQLNFSMPTALIWARPSHLVSPSWLLAPQGVFSRMTPGFCRFSAWVTCFTRNLSTRMQLLDEKIQQIKLTGADVIATANPGCMTQLEAGLRRHRLTGRVVHVIELLDAGYR